MSNPKEITSRLNNLMLRATKKQRKCGFKDCREPTARNHTVSNCLINNFVENGHVRMLAVDPWKSYNLSFNRVGSNEATTFHGLCNAHDSEVFLPIDKVDLNPFLYQNQILLAYRSVLQEKLKKTIKKEVYSQFSDEFKHISNPGVLRARKFSKMFEYNLFNAVWYEERLLSDLENNTQKFLFKTLKLPYFDLAGSELNTFEADASINLKRSFYESYGHFEPFADIFISLLPNPNKEYLTAVLGSHEKDNKKLFALYEQLNNTPPLKCLSDILLLYMDGWVCSEHFYNKHLKHQLQLFAKVFEKTSEISASLRHTSFNLFGQKD